MRKTLKYNGSILKRCPKYPFEIFYDEIIKFSSVLVAPCLLEGEEFEWLK